MQHAYDTKIHLQCVRRADTSDMHTQHGVETAKTALLQRMYIIMKLLKVAHPMKMLMQILIINMMLVVKLTQNQPC